MDDITLGDLLVSEKAAIETMQRAGINDYLIATIITGIASRAASYEFHRIQRLMELAPPKYIHPSDIIAHEFFPSNQEKPLP